MLDDKTIQSAVARLVAAATTPSQAILFGSHGVSLSHNSKDKPAVHELKRLL